MTSDTSMMVKKEIPIERWRSWGSSIMLRQMATELRGENWMSTMWKSNQWRLKKDRLQQVSKTQMEEQLNAMAEVKRKAKIITKQIKIANFKAPHGWWYRFFWRHNLSMGRKTHIAQTLPEDYEDKVTDFQRFIIQQRKRNDNAPVPIRNADQTPLTFNIPYTTIIDTNGDRSISITTKGNEKNRFTAMLVCTLMEGSCHHTSSSRGKPCLKRSFQMEW